MWCLDTWWLARWMFLFVLALVFVFVRFLGFGWTHFRRWALLRDCFKLQAFTLRFQIWSDGLYNGFVYVWQHLSNYRDNDECGQQRAVQDVATGLREKHICATQITMSGMNGYSLYNIKTTEREVSEYNNHSFRLVHPSHIASSIKKSYQNAIMGAVERCHKACASTANIHREKSNNSKAVAAVVNKTKTSVL